MIKLVLYTENYFPGGLERFIFDLVKSRLFDVYIIVNSENSRIIEFAASEKIPYSIVELSQLKLQISNNTVYNKLIKVMNFFGYYYSMFPNYFKLKRELAKVADYENIIIVNGGYPAALSTLMASIAAKKLGFEKVGLSILSSPSSYYANFFFRFFQSKIDTIVKHYTDFYIPNSKKIKSALVENVKIESEKIHVVYTGVDIPKSYDKLEKIQYQNGEIIKNNSDIWIAMVALLGSTKRQDIVLEAISRLESRVKLLLAGDGPSREALQKKTATLNLEDRVVFMGWIEDPHDVYRFADIIVFVSDQEGLPYCISEAMSYKLPIVASAVGGVPEQIIDNRGGMLIQTNSVKELVEKITYLIDNNTSRDEFSNYSFERVKDIFSTQTMNNTLVELYKKSN